MILVFINCAAIESLSIEITRNESKNIIVDVDYQPPDRCL